jgi:hypothetical protein
MDRLLAAFARCSERSDRRLALSIAGALFVSCAWPVLLLPLPPYQDLPGHLATVTILAHLDRYPEYVSNGWLKSNSAVLAWTYFVGKAIGIQLAARVFVLATLAVTAFALPRTVMRFAGRPATLMALPFAWPMVHNWFVSMGMLNFALGFGLSLELVLLLDRQRNSPTRARAAGIAVLGLAIWYASSIPLCVVGLLVAVEIAVQPDMKARFRSAARLVPPLLLTGLLVVSAVLRHATGTMGGRFGEVGEIAYRTIPWVAYDAWAHWFYAFTELEAPTLLVAVVLAVIAVRRARERVPFFSPWALGALLVLYLSLPSMMPGFGYVADRVLPFLWVAALTRVPARLPRLVWGACATASALACAGLCVDLFRLARDQDAYAAGLDVVPEGSRLLALTFSTRVTSRNTWSLRHASGIYVMERLTTAQDVWADSPTMPLSFREPPTFFQDPVRLERFVTNYADRQAYCDARVARGQAPSACASEWHAAWDGFWTGALGRFDHVVLFGATADALSTVPGGWRPCLRRGLLIVLERAG